MKKTAYVSLYSFMFLVIASVISAFLKASQVTSPAVLLVIGALVIVLSAILAYIFKTVQAVNLLCFVMCAVALGIILRAWYVLRGLDNPLWVILLVCGAALMYLWIFTFLAMLPGLRSHKQLFAFIYALISLAVYVIVVFTTKTSFVSTFGFYMIVETAFIYALVKDASGIGELVRHITVSTFSVIGVAVIVAVMIFAGDGDLDCDCSGDCCDFGFSGNEKKKKPRGDNVDLSGNFKSE